MGIHVALSKASALWKAFTTSATKYDTVSGFLFQRTELISGLTVLFLLR